MNIRDLEYFNQLSKRLSYTVVAQDFNVSQPTVTYAIKRLETLYDCQLVIKDPSHRSVVLTQEGQLLNRHIETILEEFKITKKAIEHSKKNKLHIGFPPIIRARILSQILDNQETISALSQFNIVSGGSSRLLSQLLSGELDFSLLGSIEPLHHPSLNINLLYKREFSIFVSKDHPLASKKEISFSETLAYPFVILDESSVHQKAFQQLNQKYHNKAKVILNLPDAQTIGQVVKTNIGITLMSDFLPFSDEHDLVKIPLVESDKLYFYVQYAYLTSSLLNSQLLSFKSILDEMARQ